MVWWFLFLGIVAALLFIALAWKPVQSIIREVHAERAAELFRLQREHLEAIFLQKAAATGKPRGLRWKQFDWGEEVVFARERSGRRLMALVAVSISFEAIEGSDMEGLPAVANLRNATAVFFFGIGRWETEGRVLFNMNPNEVLGHLHAELAPVQIAK